MEWLDLVALTFGCVLRVTTIGQISLRASVIFYGININIFYTYHLSHQGSSKWIYVCVLSGFSHFPLFESLWTVATRLLCPWDSLARILECVAMTSSSGSSWLRDGICISLALSSRFFTTVPPGKQLQFRFLYNFIYTFIFDDFLI